MQISSLYYVAWSTGKWHIRRTAHCTGYCVVCWHWVSFDINCNFYVTWSFLSLDTSDYTTRCHCPKSVYWFWKVKNQFSVLWLHQATLFITYDGSVDLNTCLDNIQMEPWHNRYNEVVLIRLFPTRLLVHLLTSGTGWPILIIPTLILMIFD